MTEKMAFIVELTLDDVTEYERQVINLAIQNELHRLLHARVQAFDSLGNLVVRPVIEVNTLRVDALQ